MPTAAPGSTATFSRLAPKATLPSGATCATLVRKTAEKVAQNAGANQTVPSPKPTTKLDGVDSTDWSMKQNYNGRIDGNFKGTTDEIIQWAACKWGLGEDDLRAKAYVESTWRQNHINSDGEYSVGLMQVNQDFHSCMPACLDSTAYNADWAGAWQRTCVDGDLDWLGADYKNTVTNYASGTNATRLHEGCIGVWYSGEWYTGTGGTGNSFMEYVNEWRGRLTGKPWLKM